MPAEAANWGAAQGLKLLDYVPAEDRADVDGFIFAPKGEEDSSSDDGEEEERDAEDLLKVPHRCC